MRKALECTASEFLLLGPGGAGAEGHGSVLLRLAAFRPDLVLAEGFGHATLQAALYRSLRPATRLLVWTTAPLPPLMPTRFLAARVDGVLAQGEPLAGAIERLDFPLVRTVAPAEGDGLAPFLAVPLTRRPEEAHRLVYVGDLAPQTGIADLLMSASVWAERHLERSLDIWWVGQGDLRGILEAQPLPGNLAQTFLGELEEAELPAVFAHAGLLVVPALQRGQPHLARQALAAGLPVLGSTHGRRMRELVQEGRTGWLLDPLRPGAMPAALDLALTASPAELARMRELARQSVRPPSEAAGEGGLGWALRALLRELMPAAPAAVAGA